MERLRPFFPPEEVKLVLSRVSATCIAACDRSHTTGGSSVSKLRAVPEMARQFKLKEAASPPGLRHAALGQRFPSKKQSQYAMGSRESAPGGVRASHRCRVERAHSRGRLCHDLSSTSRGSAWKGSFRADERGRTRIGGTAARRTRLCHAGIGRKLIACGWQSRVHSSNAALPRRNSYVRIRQQNPALFLTNRRHSVPNPASSRRNSRLRRANDQSNTSFTVDVVISGESGVFGGLAPSGAGSGSFTCSDAGRRFSPATAHHGCAARAHRSGAGS